MNWLIQQLLIFFFYSIMSRSNLDYSYALELRACEMLIYIFLFFFESEEFAGYSQAIECLYQIHKKRFTPRMIIAVVGLVANVR